MDFQAMTKAQIGAFGAERGIHLDERWTKARMIAEIEAGLAARGSEPETSAVPKTGRIVIRPGQGRTEHFVGLNGRSATLREGEPVFLHPSLVSALRGAGIAFDEV